MDFEYANGEDVTNNKHLAEAIDLTREGSAPPDSVGYDEGESPSLRDSTFYSAIEKLNQIDSAPQESQETIDEVIKMLQAAQNAPNDERSRVMGKARQKLQDVWVPPTD